MQSLEVISLNIWQILISLCNLLILFLILKRFLYYPVKKVMAQRRTDLDNQYQAAKTAQDEAEASKAAYLLAKENHAEKEYSDALLSLQALMEQNPGYLDFLASSCIPKQERIGAVEEAFAADYPVHIVSFMQLLTENGQIHLFPEIVQKYTDIYHAANRMVTARIISAAELRQDEKNALCRKLEVISGCTVLPVFTLDETILGGVVVQIGDKMLDGSLKNRLSQIKEVMRK